MPVVIPPAARFAGSFGPDPASAKYVFSQLLSCQEFSERRQFAAAEKDFLAGPPLAPLP